MNGVLLLSLSSGMLIYSKSYTINFGVGISGANDMQLAASLFALYTASTNFQVSSSSGNRCFSINKGNCTLTFHPIVLAGLSTDVLMVLLMNAHLCYQLKSIIYEKICEMSFLQSIVSNSKSKTPYSARKAFDLTFGGIYCDSLRCIVDDFRQRLPSSCAVLLYVPEVSVSSGTMPLHPCGTTDLSWLLSHNFNDANMDMNHLKAPSNELNQEIRKSVTINKTNKYDAVTNGIDSDNKVRVAKTEAAIANDSASFCGGFFYNYRRFFSRSNSVNPVFEPELSSHHHGGIDTVTGDAVNRSSGSGVDSLQVCRVAAANTGVSHSGVVGDRSSSSVLDDSAGSAAVLSPRGISLETAACACNYVVMMSSNGPSKVDNSGTGRNRIQNAAVTEPLLGFICDDFNSTDYYPLSALLSTVEACSDSEIGLVDRTGKDSSTNAKQMHGQYFMEQCLLQSATYLTVSYTYLKKTSKVEQPFECLMHLARLPDVVTSECAKHKNEGTTSSPANTAIEKRGAPSVMRDFDEDDVNDEKSRNDLHAASSTTSDLTNAVITSSYTKAATGKSILLSVSDEAIPPHGIHQKIESIAAAPLDTVGTTRQVFAADYACAHAFGCQGVRLLLLAPLEENGATTTSTCSNAPITSLSAPLKQDLIDVCTWTRFCLSQSFIPITNERPLDHYNRFLN